MARSTVIAELGIRLAGCHRRWGKVGGMPRGFRFIVKLVDYYFARQNGVFIQLFFFLPCFAASDMDIRGSLNARSVFHPDFRRRDTTADDIPYCLAAADIDG